MMCLMMCGYANVQIRECVDYKYYRRVNLKCSQISVSFFSKIIVLKNFTKSCILRLFFE